MMSVEQSYSRLFRPWDASESAKHLNAQTEINFTRNEEAAVSNMKPKKKLMDSKRENRLRKIRGHYKKPHSNIDQDCTISTTTLDSEDNPASITIKIQSTPSDSPVASLSECCDRLLKEPSQKPAKKSKEPKIPAEDPSKNLYTVPTPNFHIPPPDLMHQPELFPGFAPDLLPPAELAHALGLQPTDPLLLESLAQGYAMELEYARIMHQENQAKLLNARKQRPKKYKCPHCQVGFSNNGQLKGHIRIHTGERPFKCDDKNCGKTFTRNEELTRHKRIHSGLRPYACQTCGKKFGRRDHLKKHTRTHLMQAEQMMPVFLPLSAVPHMGPFPYLYGY